MKAKEAIRQQFGLVYQTIARNTEGLSHEDSVRQPSPGGNCANWILGHVISVHNNALQMLGEAPVMDGDELAGVLENPITSADAALDWNEMRQKFLASEDRCLAAIGALESDRLDEGGYPHPFGGEVTLGEILALLAFHQAYHAGQFGLSRRLAGREGAITGPGEREAASV